MAVERACAALCGWVEQAQAFKLIAEEIEPEACLQAAWENIH